MQITTAGSGFDTLLAVYRGSSVSGLTLVSNGSNDDYGGTAQSQVTISVTAGVAYQIAVDGRNGASGNIRLTVTPINPVTTLTVDGSPLDGQELLTGQVRWYRFTLRTRKAIYVETVTYDLDTTLDLFGDAPDYRHIATDYDTGIGYSAKISGRVLSPGTYYVRVMQGNLAYNSTGTFKIMVYSRTPEAVNLIDWTGLKNVSAEMYAFFSSSGAGIVKLAMGRLKNSADQALINEAKDDLKTAKRRLGVFLRDPAFDLSVNGSASANLGNATGIGDVSLGVEGSVNFLPGVITGPNKQLTLMIALSAEATGISVYKSCNAQLGLIFEDAGIQELYKWYGTVPPNLWEQLVRDVVKASPLLQSLNLIRISDAAVIEVGSSSGYYRGARLPYKWELQCKVGAGVSAGAALEMDSIKNGILAIARLVGDAIQGKSGNTEEAVNDLLSQRYLSFYGLAYAEARVEASGGVPVPQCPIAAAGISLGAGAQLSFSPNQSADRQGPLMRALVSDLAGWLDQ